MVLLILLLWRTLLCTLFCKGFEVLIFDGDCDFLEVKLTRDGEDNIDAADEDDDKLSMRLIEAILYLIVAVEMAAILPPTIDFGEEDEMVDISLGTICYTYVLKIVLVFWQRLSSSVQ